MDFTEEFYSEFMKFAIKGPVQQPLEELRAEVLAMSESLDAETKANAVEAIKKATTHNQLFQFKTVSPKLAKELKNGIQRHHSRR